MISNNNRLKYIAEEMVLQYGAEPPSNGDSVGLDSMKNFPPFSVNAIF